MCIFKTINAQTLISFTHLGIVDFEKHYPELKSYCTKLSTEIPNYMKANAEGATKFGGFGGENVKKAVEKLKE